MNNRSLKFIVVAFCFGLCFLMTTELSARGGHRGGGGRGYARGYVHGYVHGAYNRGWCRPCPPPRRYCPPPPPRYYCPPPPPPRPCVIGPCCTSLFPYAPARTVVVTTAPAMVVPGTTYIIR